MARYVDDTEFYFEVVISKGRGKLTIKAEGMMIKIGEEMIKKGYNQIKKFSWEKTAKETLEVLESLKK